MNPDNYYGFPRYRGQDPDHRVKQRTEDIDTEWMEDANCLGLDPTLFFPERGDMAAIREAKAVCAHCSVRARCAEESKDERYGIWAGLTPSERGKVHGRKRQWPT